MPSVLPKREPTIKPDNVRLARRGDTQKIYDLLQPLHAENGIFSMDKQSVLETIKNGTEERGGIIGVIEDGGRLAGSIGLYLSKYWYTTDWHLAEYWNFVHPDYRTCGYGTTLVDFAKWANENLRVPLMMGIISTTKTEAKMRLYDRKLIRVGGFFMNGLVKSPEIPATQFLTAEARSHG